MIDPLPSSVPELFDVINNFAATQNAQRTDLVANLMSVTSDNVNNETTAEVAYTINSPVPVDPFRLRVGIDRDPANGIIDAGAFGQLTDIMISDAADLMPGTHVFAIPNFRPLLNAQSPKIGTNDTILATLDVLLDGTADINVDESEELANNTTAQAQSTDVIANSVALMVDVGAGTAAARIAYTIDSPGTVAAFSVRVGIDRDGDSVIDNGGSDLFDTFALGGVDLEPGAHIVCPPTCRRR
ncbi:MAG: hypothetical protein V3T70_01760 [Phycisphaerae bacterium]